MNSYKMWGLVLIVIVLIGLVLGVKPTDNTCVEESKVVEIVRAQYRSVYIRLENGNIVQASQATLQAGDMWCTKRAYQVEE